MDWPELIKELFREHRYNTYKFEKDFGVSNVAIGKILNGITKKPNTQTIKIIENAFNIKIDDSDPNNLSYIKLPVEKKKEETDFDDKIQIIEYPILSEVFAGNPDRIDVEYVSQHESFTYFRRNHRCFALKVNGNSMETTLRNGDIVLVDMDLQPMDGDLVAVKLKNGNQYIKRYKDLNFAFIQLSSDNPDYGVRIIDKNDIVAIYPIVSINLNLRNGERKY
ncbi:MAG: S24 family peptidase [Bacteroidota bacterium]